MSSPAPRGAAHWKARLTEADVRAIRASSEPDSALARRYGVTKSAVTFARSGRSWAHLPGGAARRDAPVALPGEGHHFAKLKTEDVLALRAGTASPAAIRKHRGVSKLAIWRARTGATWKHLPNAC
jgi:hypothetical protein